MSDTTAALLQQLLALPADVNPYAWLKRVAWRQVTPEILPWARAIAYVNIGAIFLSGIFAAWALWERKQQRSLWFFRVQSTRCGRLVLPNTTALFAACSVAFVPCAIWNMTFLVVAGQNDTIASTPNMWLYIIVWIPLHAAIWSEAQGLSIAVLLASTRVRIPATLVNIFFLGLFPIPTLVNLPGFVLASLRMQDVWDAYSNIAAALKPSIEAWTPGAAFRLEPEWLSLVGAYERAGDRYFPAAAHAGACHLVGHALVAVVFVPASLAYFSVLQKQLGQPTYFASTSSSSSTGNSNARLRNLRNSYHAMIFECLAVLLGATTYVAVCIWVVVDSRAILLSALRSDLLYFLPFCIWSLFGLPANALIAWRLWQQRSSASKVDSAADAFGPLSLVEGIRVDTEVSVAVDGEHELEDSKSRRVVVDLPDRFGRESFIEMDSAEKEKETGNRNWA